MLTARGIGPDLAEPSEGLVGFYQRALCRHWHAADRAAGHALGRFGIGGWTAAERALLSPEIRARGLSMADRRGIHRLLNPGAVPMRSSPLKNKQIFAARAHAAGLPLPDTVTEAAERLVGWIARQDDIVVKPGFGSKGRGVRRFSRVDGSWWRLGAETLRETDLLARLAMEIGRGGVVQRRLATHGFIADLSPGALATLRVVTCRDEAGQPEAAALAMRFSAGSDNPVDNFNAGNLVCAVGEEGRCEAAWGNAGGRPERHRVHPLTGAPIARRMLPDFDAALALALRAHEAFGEGFTVIGWDIGLSTRGPVLIEGNWNPGTDIVQLVAQAGLADLRLGALYLHHLRRLPDAAWGAARPLQWDSRW